MTTKIIKEVKCLKCGSFIHETERCYVWRFQNYCERSKKNKQNCNCIHCTRRCKFCNSVDCYYHSGSRCDICNEFLFESLSGYLDGNNNFLLNPPYCSWNHNKPPCKYCGSPVFKSNNMCSNSHDDSKLCSECNMPEKYPHRHDGNVCKICGTLLESGRCIYKCVGGGKFCIHCNYEGVVNNQCLMCRKDNTGQLTKCAKK